MGSAFTTHDTPKVLYFTDVLPGNRAARFAAAVVLRGVPSGAALAGGTGPLGWLRRLRHRFWLRLGPLGVDVSVAGRPLFGSSGPVSSVALEWDGEEIASYDHGGRTLRLLGRVMRTPPDGRTLVVLVDAEGARRDAPRMRVRRVTAPEVAVPPPPPEWESPPGAESHVIMSGEQPEWTAALRADPVVRAFMDGVT